MKQNTVKKMNRTMATVASLVVSVVSVVSVLACQPVQAAEMNGAPSSCQPANSQDSLAMTVFTKNHQKKALEELLSRYCYDSQYFQNAGLRQPYFYAKDLQTLKWFQAKNPELLDATDSFGINLLSYLLLSHINYPKLDAQQKQLLATSLQRYGLKEQEFSDKPPTVMARKDMLDYVATIYEKEVTHKRDLFGNTAAAYAVLTAEAQVLEKTIGNSVISSLLRKNKDGVTPVHLLFAHKYVMQPGKEAEMVAQTNDVVLKYLEPRYFSSLNLGSLGFFDFVELMKDNNPDFYQKLQAKYPFKSMVARVSPPVAQMAIDSLSKTMQYPARLKEMEEK